MLEIVCAPECSENEPIPEWVLPPQQGGGGGIPSTVVTADSATVEFSGDGSADTPLTATVIADHIIPYGETTLFYVDTVNGDDANPGTIGAPKQTIMSAMGIASAGDVLLVAPGVYEEDVTFAPSIGVQGYGAGAASKVSVRGSHVIPAGVSNVTTKDIALIGTTTGTAALSFDATAGGHRFVDTAISHEDGGEVLTVEFTGNNTTFASFEGGSITGAVSIDDVAQTSPFTVVFNGSSDPFAISVTPPTVQAIVQNMFEAGPANHAGGTLVLQNIVTMLENGEGDSLVSTADMGEGVLNILGVGFLQADGSYGGIFKPGSAPFFISGSKTDPLGSDLSGTNLYGEVAKSIHAQYEPTNYAPISVALYDHLMAIDEKLPTSMDGSTIEFEIAFTRLGEFQDEETLSAYANAKGFTLLSGLPDVQVVTRGLTGEFRIDIYKETDLIGFIETTGGVPAISFSSDVTFVPSELLEFRGVGAATFTLLTVTIVGLRAITVV